MIAQNPRNPTKTDMRNLADLLEEFLTELEDVIILPADASKEEQENFDEGVRVCKKLIKKLRKGDKSVFKDPDEVEDMALSTLGI